MRDNTHQSNYSHSRRSFLQKGLAVGGAGAIGAALVAQEFPALAAQGTGSLTQGDMGHSALPGRTRNPRNRFLATI